METLIILMSFLSTVSLFADLVGFYRTDEKICENWKKKFRFFCVKTMENHSCKWLLVSRSIYIYNTGA